MISPFDPWIIATFSLLASAVAASFFTAYAASNTVFHARQPTPVVVGSVTAAICLAVMIWKRRVKQRHYLPPELIWGIFGTGVLVIIGAAYSSGHKEWTFPMLLACVVLLALNQVYQVQKTKISP